MQTTAFGFCLPIFAWPGARLFRTPGFRALDTQRCMQLGALADALGYASLWVADHLMLGSDEAILEGWTTLAALAGMTRRARLGIIHYNNAIRHPALTAKTVATLDQISNGRMIHFVDYGNQPREFLAYGLHADDTREERVAQMCEGLDLTCKLWEATAPLTVTGSHYSVRNAICMPKPVQQPRPPIWIGEATPELLDATARWADGWNSTPVSTTELRSRLDQLRAACERAGRAFDEIEKTLEIQILIAPTLDGLRAKLRALWALAPDGELPAADMRAFLDGATDLLPAELRETWLAGTPEMVRARVAEYEALGITHFMLWFVDAPDDSGMRLFAQTCALRAE